ncbi:MAG TPA: VOC family protein [Bacteroidia bacterium]
MLNTVCPKLPMRDKAQTLAYYTQQLGFSMVSDFEAYLILQKDNIEIHFFEFKDLNPSENYGQVYIRCNDIDGFYQSLLNNEVAIHPNSPLSLKPWGQKEFALLDPDNNLLTFGEGV